MAIGSAPEIGGLFKEGIDGWLDHDVKEWREFVGDDLLGGYASLQHPKRWPQGAMP